MTDREKLIEILRKPIFPHELVDPIEAVADYLLDNGVTIATDNNVGDKLSPTNADRIRAMSDEELAKVLIHGCQGSKCEDQPQNEYGSVNCFDCRMKWLQQPVED